MLNDLVLKNRSYRRFYQDVTMELETLRELVNLARLSASGANRQALLFYRRVSFPVPTAYDTVGTGAVDPTTKPFLEVSVAAIVSLHQ